MYASTPYPTRIYDILVYGGALAIVLFVFLIIAGIILLVKANRMINTGKQAIQTVTSSVVVPFMTLASIVTPLLRSKTKKTTKTTKTTKAKTSEE